MRTLTSIAVVLVAVAAAACSAEKAPGTASPAAPTSQSAAPTGRPATTGENVYGNLAPGATPVNLADLVANPSAYDGKTVRVEGTITDVCAKRGCWMRLGADAAPDTVLFKVTDGVIVFPMSDRGRYAVADGVARAVPLDLERSREILAERAKAAGTKFDPATVTTPLTTVRLDGLGARVRDGK